MNQVSSPDAGASCVPGRNRSRSSSLWRDLRLRFRFAMLVAAALAAICRAGAAQDAAVATLAVFADEPTLAEVQRMAEAATGAVTSDVARIRRSAWLPERVVIDAGGDLDGTRRDESVVDQDFDEVLEPDSSGTRWLERSDAGQSATVGLRLEWNLTRLVWSADELRATDAVLERLDEARERSREVAGLWAERRAAQVGLMLASTDDIAARAELIVAIERLTGEIDALTGGAFRAALGDAASR